MRQPGMGAWFVVAAVGCGGQPVGSSPPPAEPVVVAVPAEEPAPAAELDEEPVPVPPKQAPTDAGDEAVVGKLAPAVTAKSLAGEGPDDLEEARGRVVIVDFWATYCTPCGKTMRFYQQLIDRYPGQVAVIGVSVDHPDDATDAQVMTGAQGFGARYSIARDVDLATAERWDPPKMPTSYVVDRKGVLRFVHAGFTAADATVIEQEVVALIAER